MSQAMRNQAVLDVAVERGASLPTSVQQVMSEVLFGEFSMLSLGIAPADHEVTTDAVDRIARVVNLATFAYSVTDLPEREMLTDDDENAAHEFAHQWLAWAASIMPEWDNAPVPEP